MKKLLKKLPEAQYIYIKKMYRKIFSTLNQNNLTKLAIINKTDKGTTHQYTKHYEFHLSKKRKQRLNILEIGIGGYQNPNLGGESLRMWKYYFPNSNIYGIDIFDKNGIDENRIKTFKGSQVDKEFLERIYNEIGSLDIIIDDGSHINEHIIETFKILFPLLKQNGIYIIEDIQTSYWPDFGYGGDSMNLSNPATSMNFFKKLADCINYEEFINPEYQPTYYDQNIISIHFYHSMVFICKGDNNEGSNFIKNNIRVLH
jgi:demethylmacrocin O-methyltransferase